MPTQTLLATQAITILEAAQASEYGKRIKITALNDTPTAALRARQVLYRFQRECAPAFDGLHIRLAPDDPDGGLWIIKRSTPVARVKATPTQLLSALDIDI